MYAGFKVIGYLYFQTCYIRRDGVGRGGFAFHNVVHMCDYR